MSLHLVPRALRYLEQVAQTGSIQAASRELGISASAIHRQITAIEGILGEALFNREAKGMSLTPTGRLMLDLARDWRLDNARLSSEIQKARGIEHGTVRIAAMDSMVNGFILDIIQDISLEFPNVTVEVEIKSPDNAVKGLLNGDFEIAAVANARPHAYLKSNWTREFPLGCIATPDHPVAGQGSISLNEFVSHPVVFQSAALAIRKLLEARHGWIFDTAKRAIVVNSIQLMKHLVGSGHYIAVTSQLDAGPEIMSGRLKFIPISDRDIFSQSISLLSNSQIPESGLRRRVLEMAVHSLERISTHSQSTD